MSAVVENRVVELQFDNKEFEKNVQESLKSLQKLREDLNMEEAAKKLSSIDDAVSRMNFSGLLQKVDEIGSHFTAIGRIADNIFGRVTNAAISTGTSVAKSLTIDQVSSGMSKYEQQVKAIQTISSATGMSVAQIQPYIEELMKYSDDTSYSFTNMISSLGKFLNAGRSIEESVTAIKGISNEAAHAGAGIEEANRAMYNFSQALSMGYVQKIDWKSIENANMATQSFKNELIKAGKELGTLDKKGRVAVKGQKKIEVTANNLSETLSKQWLTADVLMRALEEYGNVETDIGKAAFKAAKETKTFTEMIEYLKDAISSGWLLTFEALIGDYEEATKLWSAVADELGTIFGEMAEKRNLMMDLWKGHGGRFALIEALQNLWDIAKNLMKAVGDGWSKVFPDSAVLKAKDLVHLTNDFRNFTTELKENFDPETEQGAANLAKISTLFQGIAKVVESVEKFVGRIVGVVVDEAGKTSGPLLDLAGVIGEFLFGLGEGIENGTVMSALADGFAKLFNLIVDYAPSAVEWIKTTYAEIKKWLSEGNNSEELSKSITTITESLERNLPLIIDAGKKLANFIKEVIIGTDFKTLHDNATAYLKPVIDWFKEFGSVLSMAFGVSMNVDTSGIEDPLEKVKAKIEPFKLIMESWLGTKLDQAYAFVSVKLPIIHDIIEAVKEFYAELEKLAGGDLPKYIGEKFDQFTSFVNTIWEKLKGVTENKETESSDKVNGVFDVLLEAAGKIKEFITGFVEEFGGVKEVTGEIAEGAKTGAMTATQRLIEMFNSVVTWLKENLNWENITTVASWVGKTSLLFNVSSFVGNLSGVVKGIKNKINGEESGIGDVVFKLAESMALIVASMYFVAMMDDKTIGRAASVLIGLGVGLLAFSFLINKVSGSGKGINGIGTSILLAVIAIRIMWKAVEVFAEADLATIGKAMLAIGLLLTELIVFSRLAGNNTGKGFIGLAASVLILSFAMKSFANMEWKDLQKGLVGVGALLLELGLFLKLGFGNGKVSAKAVLSMIAMGVAINMLIPPIQALGKMDGKDIAKSLAAMGALLLGMGVYMKLAGGGNIISSVVSLVAMAGAMIIMVEGIKAMAATGIDPDSVKKLSEGIAAMMIGFGVGIKLLSTGDMTSGAVAALNLLEFVGIMTAALIGIGAINETFPDLQKFIDSGGELLQKVGEAIGKFVNGLINGIFGRTSMDSFMTDINTMGDGLNSFAEKMAGFESKSIEEAITAMVKLGEAAASIPRSGGIVQAVIGEHDINKFATDLPVLGTGLNGFATNIKGIDNASVQAAANSASLLVAIAKDVPSSGGVLDWLFGQKDLSAFSSQLPSLGRGLKRFDTSIKGIDADAITKAGNATQVLVNLANELPYTEGSHASILGWILGEKNLSTFGDTLVPLGNSLSDFNTSIKDLDSDAISKAGNAAAILTNLASQIPYSSDGFSVLKFLMGDQDLGKFGSTLPQFGAGLKAFGDSVKGMNSDEAATAAHAAEVLAALAKEMPAQGGLIQWIMGDQDLGEFGTNIAELGTGLKSFGDETSGIDVSGTDAAILVLDKLINSANQLTAVGGYAGMITSLFGSNQLDIIGSNLNKLALQMSTINVVQTSMAFDLLAKLGQVLTAFSSKEVRENAKNAKAALRTLTQDDEFMNLMKIMATSMTGGIIDALQNESKDDSNTSTAAKLVGEKIVTVINSYEGDAYNAGTNLMLGLRNGILEHAGYASDAMAEAMSGATGAGEKVAEIASPSKVTTRMGRFLDEGLALGIRDFASLPETEARSMMDGVITASQEAAAMMEYLLNTDPTLTPTITPVFDMRSVREGAGYLNGTISSLNGLRFGGISTGNIAAEVIANNDAGGVIAALNQINGQLIEMEEAITNMQVVLDGKALVGHIESDVDRRLGMRAIREERRG